jgi:hypothetical protein
MWIFVFVGASTCRVAGAPGIRSPIEIFSSLLTKKKSNWGTGHVMTETPGAPHEVRILLLSLKNHHISMVVSILPNLPWACWHFYMFWNWAEFPFCFRLMPISPTMIANSGQPPSIWAYFKYPSIFCPRPNVK